MKTHHQVVVYIGEYPDEETQIKVSKKFQDLIKDATGVTWFSILYNENPTLRYLSIDNDNTLGWGDNRANARTYYEVDCNSEIIDASTLGEFYAKS